MTSCRSFIDVQTTSCIYWIKPNSSDNYLLNVDIVRKNNLTVSKAFLKARLIEVIERELNREFFADFFFLLFTVIFMSLDIIW